MRSVVFVIVALLVVGLGALVISFRPAVLEVPPDFAVDVPEADASEALRISVIETGHMESLAALAYRGGGFTDTRNFTMSVIVIEHPDGIWLVDAGFGRDVDSHVETTPWLLRAMADYEAAQPALEQLAQGGIEPADIDGVIVTHAHWDHVSGLADMPEVPAWIPEAERDFIEAGDAGAELAAALDVRWQTYDFEDGRYMGFEQSLDLFGDGSVVIVPAGGHTPGSVMVFVTTADEARYALIGDIAWQREGVELPTERPWLTRTLFDVDAATVRERLVHLRQLQAWVPDLTIVPAHDERAMAALPRFDANAPRDAAARVRGLFE